MPPEFFDIEAWLCTSCGKSPLMLAAERNHPDVVKFLLQHGCDVNKRDIDGKTALHYSIEYGSKEITEMLLQTGAKINVQSKRGETPLMLAAETNQPVKVIILLLYGSDVLEKDFDGKTALHYSVESGSEEITEMLIQTGAKINVRSFRGETPLMLAAERNLPGVVELLLQYGSDVHKRNQLGKTALHYSVKSNSKEITKMLFQAEAKVNIQSSGGLIPLKLAVKNHQDEVKLWLQHDCDVDVMDWFEQALHYSFQSGIKEITVFSKAGAKINVHSFRHHGHQLKLAEGKTTSRNIPPIDTTALSKHTINRQLIKRNYSILCEAIEQPLLADWMVNNDIICIKDLECKGKSTQKLLLLLLRKNGSNWVPLFMDFLLQEYEHLYGLVVNTDPNLCRVQNHQLLTMLKQSDLSKFHQVKILREITRRNIERLSMGYVKVQNAKLLKQPNTTLDSIYSVQSIQEVQTKLMQYLGRSNDDWILPLVKYCHESLEKHCFEAVFGVY